MIQLGRCGHYWHREGWLCSCLTSFTTPTLPPLYTGSFFLDWRPPRWGCSGYKWQMIVVVDSGSQIWGDFIVAVLTWSSSFTTSSRVSIGDDHEYGKFSKAEALNACQVLFSNELFSKLIPCIEQNMITLLFHANYVGHNVLEPTINDGVYWYLWELILWWSNVVIILMYCLILPHLLIIPLLPYEF